MTDKKVFVAIVSKQFRITIPAELRRILGVRVGDEAVWTLQDNHALVSFRRARKQHRIPRGRHPENSDTGAGT